MDVMIYKSVNMNSKPDMDSPVFYIQEWISGNVLMSMLLPGFLLYDLFLEVVIVRFWPVIP